MRTAPTCLAATSKPTRPPRRRFAANVLKKSARPSPRRVPLPVPAQLSAFLPRRGAHPPAVHRDRRVARPPLRHPLRGRMPHLRRALNRTNTARCPIDTRPHPRYTSPHGCRCLWRHNSAGPPLGACARPAADNPASPDKARSGWHTPPLLVQRGVDNPVVLGNRKRAAAPRKLRGHFGPSVLVACPHPPRSTPARHAP